MTKSTRQKWNILSLLPAILVVGVIFYFSLQPGPTSRASSDSVSTGLISLFGGAITLTQAQYDTFTNLVRIIAHMGEYAVLAITIAYACTRNGIRRQLRAGYMCLICFWVSLIDEFVQIFVPDRYGDPLDVIVDMLGVVLISVFILKVRKTRSLPRSEEMNCSRRDYVNISLDDVDFNEAVDRIMAFAAEDEYNCRLMVTPNVDHIIKLETDKDFQEVYKGADLIVPDGKPLMWIGESFSCPLKEKISGSDLLFPVCERAAKEGRSLFFFGTSDEVIAAAKEKLCAKYPGLNIAGGYAPPMGFGKKQGDVERAVKQINKVGADILVVGLGAPKSEKFIYNNRHRLKAKVALPIGAAIAFAADMQKRAPEWMQRAGLEWFYRFLQEPGRLFKRYFIDDIKIFFMALKYRDRTVEGYTGTGTEACPSEPKNACPSEPKNACHPERSEGSFSEDKK